MYVEWFGFQNPLPPTINLSPAGILTAVLYLGLAAFAFVRNFATLRTMTGARWIFLAALCGLGFVSAQLAIMSVTIDPGIGSIEIVPLLFLPLVVGALLLGTTPAMLIGLAVGLALMLFRSGRITQPLEWALTASVVSWLLDQPFRGTLIRLLRQPMIVLPLSVMLAAWPLGVLGMFASHHPDSLISLEWTLNASIPLLISLLMSALFAGLVAQVLITLRPDWRLAQTGDLLSPPWQRHLSQRVLFTLAPLLTLAIIALVSVLAVISYRVATRLIVEQLARDAANAGENIPFFIQVGRGLIGSLAQDPALEDGASEEDLAQGLHEVPFFQQLIYLDAEGELSASYPPDSVLDTTLSNEELTRVEIALAERIPPAEVVLLSDTAGDDAAISFIAPVILDETSDASGVLVGRTVLTANPVLTPVVEILESGFVGSGVGFVMDEQNRILLHPAQPESQQQHFSMNPISEIAPPLREGRAFHQREADGTRDLIYVLPIVGRSDWSIVVTMPNEVVLALAAQIAVPMLVLLLGLTAVAVPLIITVTHRITGPLEQLLIGVDALSKGDLTHPVQVSGEDEIGRLGQAFEQMQIRLKDRLDEQERLLRVSRSVSSSLELFRAMPPILSSALEVSNAAGVRMVIRRSGSPPESYSAGEAAAVIAPLDTHLMEMVERQGTLVISQLWRASHTLDTAALPSNIQALMALPLRSDTSFHGILWLAYDHEHVFEQPEMTFLSTLASQAAVGIANAKLFAEAQEERRKLEGVLESTADAMIVADQQGRIALLNPAAEQYLGARADLVRGKRAQEVIEVEALASLLTDLQEPVSVLELPGQRGKVLLANVSTIFSHEGTISGRVAVMRDITALKELDNIKTVFLRMVSHDLRSPLTYMRGYLSMLPLAGDLNDRQEEAIEKVNSGINSISDLTERLLYLSRLQFGEEAELEVSLIDITDLVHEVVMQQEDVTRDRDVAVRLEMQEKLPLLAADAMLYRQAVANLISNALKYTPDGGQIVIRAFQVSENGHAQITVSVEDTGIGIREEDQSRLFEAFFRVPQREGDPVRPRGTGLGLALVKAIATAHGGTVGVQSRFGQGSVFHITLPVRLPEDL